MASGISTKYEDFDPETNAKTRSFFDSVDPDILYGVSHGNRPFLLCAPGAMATEAYRKQIGKLFRVVPCPYDHRSYQFAGVIFDVMRHDVRHFRYNASRFGKRQYRSGVRRQTKKEISALTKILQMTSLPVGKPEVVEERLPLIEFESEYEKILSFTLVFETLKCK